MSEKKKRDYKHEYAIYHGQPDQIKRRTQRNAARRAAVKAGKASKGDGKDVHHKNGNTADNLSKNTVVISRSKNRAMGGASSKPYTRMKRSTKAKSSGKKTSSRG